MTDILDVLLSKNEQDLYFFMFYYRRKLKSWPKFTNHCVLPLVPKVKSQLPTFLLLDRTSPRSYAQAVAR